MSKRKIKSKKSFSQKIKENIYWINGVLVNFVFAAFVFSASYYLGVVEKNFCNYIICFDYSWLFHFSSNHNEILS